jgi:zinc/manganese transport system substrate-binding protein
MYIDNDSHYRSMLRGRVVHILATLALVAVTACSGQQSANEDRPLVIVTTSILGDVVSHIAGESIDMQVMIPAGVDPHDFSPSAQQVASISEADLIIANGLDLEEGLEDVLAQAESEGLAVFEVAPEVNPLPNAAHQEVGETAEGEHPHGAFDPHFWQDPERMVTATALIASALINDAGLDPQATSEGAASYGLEVERAHLEAETALSIVPPDRRVLVTNHDAFSYFADRYGFEVIGTIVPGGSTLGEPSSGDLAALVRLIVDTGVPAIFVENISSPDLASTLAAETGREIKVVELVSDALGEPGTATGSYIDLILFNARAIAVALG